MSISTPVEAQSLSSLTTLFANPPQYPGRNPTHALLDPLVLYIVRVPGSRDVFLTPLKPPTKTSISLEAIQSCLYYLHVITPEDDALRRSLDEQTIHEEIITRTPSIHRKPLPKAPFANYPPSDRPPLPPKSYPHFQPSPNGNDLDTQAARYAARGNHLRLNTNATNSGVKRKPLGPRSFHSTQDQDYEATLNGRQVSSFLDDIRDDASTNSLRQAENIPLDEVRSFMDSTAREPGQLDPYSDSVEGGQGSLTKITMIRRDPSSSAQWNIGTISFPKCAAEIRTNIAEKSVMVELSTPGYQKFAKGKGEVDLNGKVFQSADEIKSLLSSQSTDSPINMTNERPRDTLFGREVLLQGRQDSLEKMRRKAASSEPVSSLKQGFRNSPRPRGRPRFAFRSPWQGLCTFSTGMDGKSLKCRHTVSSVAQDEESSGTDVAELRFNLPWLLPRPKEVNSRGGPDLNNTLLNAGHESKESLKRRIKHLKNKSWSGGNSEMNKNLAQGLRLRPRPRSQTGDADEASESEDRMDLTLGRENAGGGFQGRNAKLGKLIIEDEGLKMCDLVVGACMGIWWQQYMTRMEE